MNRVLSTKFDLDKYILLLIFLSPACNLIVFRTGIADIRIIQILWAAAIFCLLLKKTKKAEEYVEINKGDHLIFCLYILAIIMSCLFSIDLSRSIKELIQYVYLFIIMYFLYNKMKAPDFIERAVNVLVISNAFFVLICLASYILGRTLVPSVIIFSNGHLDIGGDIYKTQFLVESGETINRISSIMGMGPISIANMVLIQSFFVNYKLITKKKHKALNALLLCANLAVVILTYSRAALLVFAALHTMLFLGKNKFKNLGIIFCIIALFAVLLMARPDILYRVLESFNVQEGSSKYHFVYWIIALKTGLKHIFTGIGLGNIAFNLSGFEELFNTFGLYETNGVDVHNFILQIWSEQGALGLLANMLLVFLPILNYLNAKLKKVKDINPLFKYTIFAYFATLAYNLTNNNFYIEIFWILLAMTYSLRARPEGSYINNCADSAENERSYDLRRFS